MAFIGTGTRSSPIAIDDSEDEVVYELSKASSPKSSPTHESFDSHKRRATPENISFVDDLRDSQHLAVAFEKSMPLEKKRKRASSFVSQDMPVAGPSHVQKQQQHSHPSLVNRLSQPESKKARKRRRKAERQAREEARLKNIDWLNNLNANRIPQPLQPYSSMSPWSIDHHAYNDLGFPYMPSISPPISSDGIFPQGYPPYNHSNPYQDTSLHTNYKSRSPSPRIFDSFMPTSVLDPPSLTSEWVSAMAMAAESSTDAGNIDTQTQYWSPVSAEVSLPPAHPPPLPPPSPPMTTVNPKATVSPEYLHHALPPKPPPPQSIGMQPDQDPNSKHGIFHIAPSSKDMGVDAKNKKKTEQHIPNPARTLVMEQLPKTYRQPDFINRWSRSACDALPVHLFIDGPNAKTLIEFATAELARRAWSSPKLGGQYAGMKSHQMKGKPREDLIKVWWYRVDGVGAGAGVGEIEEGEIEGDFAEKEPVAEVTDPKKETKKERKARLAKEREDKRLAREAELKAIKERQMQQDNQQELPSPAPKIAAPPSQNIGFSLPHATKELSLNAHAPSFQPSSTFGHQSTSTSVPTYGTFPWVQVPKPPIHPPVNKTAFGASMLLRDQGLHNDNESIGSSVASSPSDKHINPLQSSTNTMQGDNLSDFEETDMDVDEDIVVAPTPLQPLIPAPPVMHSSLPPRPPPQNSMHTSRSIGQKSYTRPPQSSTVSSSIPKGPARNLTLPHHHHHLPNLPQPSATTPQSQSQSQSQTVPPRVLHHPQPQSAHAQGKSALIKPVPVESASNPVSSGPNAIKQAPTEPSFTKRALIARQKELEEKIARSKLEIAAAAANKSTLPQGTSQSLPETPAADMDDKQAMEVRLRNLVLQSQRAKAKHVPKSTPSEPPATVSTPVIVDPPARPDHTSPTAPSTISVSAHHLSLEDLAVSFITQTIETVKAQPASTKPPTLAPSVKPIEANSRVKDDLAAKQRRLEEHISETKSLMTRLSQSRSKEEKEILLKIMKEKTRIYEEETKIRASAPASSTPTPTPTPTPSSFSTNHWNIKSNSVVNKPRSTTTAQQARITRWPVNQQDSGVLMISDDEDDESDDDCQP